MLLVASPRRSSPPDREARLEVTGDYQGTRLPSERGAVAPPGYRKKEERTEVRASPVRP